MVEQGTENPRVAGSIPAGGTIFPISDPVGEAKCECSSSGRAPPCQGGGSEFEPRHSLQIFGALCGSIWCHSQVVRQSSAKAPLPSSNLGGTSRKRHDFCRVFLLFAPVLSQKLGAGDEPGPFPHAEKLLPECCASLHLNEMEETKS